MRRGEAAARRMAAPCKRQAASCSTLVWGWVLGRSVSADVLSGENGGVAGFSLQLVACGLQLVGEQKQ